jgi:hypothetical protein
METRAIERRRNRLLRTAAYSTALVVAVSAVGFVDSLTERVAPEPSLHRILFDELAYQHFTLTTTATVVEERDKTFELFEEKYKLRNQKLGTKPVPLSLPQGGLLHFSFFPGGVDLAETPFEEMLWRRTNPTFKFTPPSGSPLALWFYSKPQQLLAVFCYEMVDLDSVKNPPAVPDPRIIEKIDRLGLTSVYGSIPDGWAVAVHAYLLPFGDLQLEKLSRHSHEDPDLSLFNFALPLLFPSTPTGLVISPDASGKDVIARLRFDAAIPFLMTRWLTRLLALPIGVLWLLFSVWRLRTLHKQYEWAVEMVLPPTERPGHVPVGFFAFLFNALENRTAEWIEQAREKYQIAVAHQQDREEKEELRSELERHRAMPDISGAHGALIDSALMSDSIEEIRRVIAVCRRVVQERAGQIEREVQMLRDREREIHRLENELETIPTEKRSSDAKEAWTLYERALRATDARERLHWLKEARKRMPKDLRPDRF